MVQTVLVENLSGVCSIWSLVLIKSGSAWRNDTHQRLCWESSLMFHWKMLSDIVCENRMCRSEGCQFKSLSLLAITEVDAVCAFTPCGSGAADRGQENGQLLLNKYYSWNKIWANTHNERLWGQIVDWNTQPADILSLIQGAFQSDFAQLLQNKIHGRISN